MSPVGVIFAAILQPARAEDSVEAIAQHFRAAIRRNHANIHIVDRLLLDPSITSLRRLAHVARKLHVGHVNACAVYVLLAMLLARVLGAGIFELASA